TMRCPGKSHAAAGTGTALAAQTARHAARTLLSMLPFLLTSSVSSTRVEVAQHTGSEKSVRRPRQAEIFAERLAFVFPPEQTAPLQFRHHALDKIVEPAGQVGKHHGETVGAFGGEPFLHLIGNGRGCADHGKPGIAAKALR